MEKAFIFAWISVVRPLARGASGLGRRAALVGPSGDEEAFMVGMDMSDMKVREGGLADFVSAEAGFGRGGVLDSFDCRSSVLLVGSGEGDGVASRSMAGGGYWRLGRGA